MSVPRAKVKDSNWSTRGVVKPDGSVLVETDTDVTHALLMDLRDALHEIRSEIRSLNRIMYCPNVIGGFRALQRIDKRLAKKVKRP
jgi:hypothetical protein